MKKSFMSVTMLVASISMVIMLLCSSVAKAQTNGKFIYDKKENVETVYTLDESGKYLAPKLKYEYEKDEIGNVVSKKAYRWNSADEKWVPYYVMTFMDKAGNVTVEYKAWNEKSRDYSFNNQKAVYNKDMQNNMISYQAYNWNPTLKIWDLSQQILSQSYLAIK